MNRAEGWYSALAAHPIRSLAIVGLAIAVIGGAGLYVFWDQAVPIVGTAVNYYRTWNAPKGTLTTETSPGARPASAAAGAKISDAQTHNDWPSYNKTLTSERFSSLKQIDVGNVANLKVLCTYDTKQQVAFQSGLLMVEGALIGTTQFDIFSLDPNTCKENWRTAETYKPVSLLSVNRGAAYADGMLYRGTEDGRVLAYDFKTGKRVWATMLANPGLPEAIPAAPIAWNGLVFIGNAGGDNKGVKGRMYALDAKTGKIVWEFFLVPKGPNDIAKGPLGATPLDIASWQNADDTPISGGATWTSYTLDPATGLLYVPGGNPAPDFADSPRKGENLYSGSMVVLDAKTGNYKTHFKLAPKDWHDWDVSTAPAVISTKAGVKLLSVAPKDGYLYGFDLATGKSLYRTAVTRMENADAPFEVGKPVHFCPGTQGGAEWNGPAYDQPTNLVLIGQVDWCSSVTLVKDAVLQNVKIGKHYAGNDTGNPYNDYGTFDDKSTWAGWVYATDADTGAWAWRVKTNYPVMSGMTPTGGGLAFFGDMGGNFYALETATGKKLWGQKIGGAIAGGVITYTAGSAQKVAVAHGMTSILWPTEVTTAKISILGLGDVRGAH